MIHQNIADIIKPHMRIFYSILFTVSVMTITSIASAQTMEERGFTPVDPLIDDVDPLAVSLRKQSIELKVDGSQRLYRRVIPANPRTGRPRQVKLYSIQRGLVAEFDQSQYSTDRRGRIFALSPPNTVFHIGLPKALPDSNEEEQNLPPELIDRRITGAINQQQKPLILAQNINRPIKTNDTVTKLNNSTAMHLSIVNKRRRRIQSVFKAIDNAIANTQ